MKTLIGACAAALWLLAIAAPPSMSQYVAYLLPVPSGFAGSLAYGASTGQQVGATAAEWGHALLWNNLSGATLDLNPGPYGSVAYAANGAYQAGANTYTTYKTTGSGRGGGGSRTYPVLHAALWHGSASSMKDLNPAGQYESAVLGLSGDAQVGWALAGNIWGPPQAYLWTGSAGSALDLNPAGYTSSEAVAVDGAVEAGYGYPSSAGLPQALVWQGTAASAVNLEPADPSINASFATSIDAASGQEAGYVNIGPYYPGIYHAYLWSGTAATGVDLNPPAFYSSVTAATRGGAQVGYGTPTGNYWNHALVWQGTAASAVDLSSLLPSTMYISEALGIDSDGSIVGFASDGYTDYPVIWKPSGARAVAITQSPDPGQTGWSAQSVAVTINSPFSGAGAVIIYRVNGGTSSTVSGSSKTVAFKSSGSEYIQAYAADGHGGQTAVQAYTVNLDLTPPVTTLSYKKLVLTLTAKDPNSGVAATYYVLDGGAATAYSMPVLLSNTAHTVQYWSVDRVGNTEKQHTAALSAVAPVLTSISPISILSGSAGFTLAVTGAGFLPNSAAQWNGSPRATTYVSSTQLSVAIPAADIATAGKAAVNVVNPAPGVGTSTSLPFTVLQTATAAGQAINLPDDGVTTGFDIYPVSSYSGFTLSGQSVHLSTGANATYMDANGNAMSAATFYATIIDGQSVSAIGTYTASTNTINVYKVQMH